MSVLVFPHHEEVDDTQACSAVFFEKNGPCRGLPATFHKLFDSTDAALAAFNSWFHQNL